MLKRLSGTISFALILLAGISIVSSCDKKNDDDATQIVPETTGYASDQLLLEHIYNNVDRVIERAFVSGASGLKGGEQALAACAKISDTTVGGETTMVIDFGNNPCLGFDGRYRQGKIIVRYDSSQKYKGKGYYQNISFEGYMVDGYRVYGSKSMINIGPDINGDYYYQVKRVDSVYVDDEDGFIRGTSERRMTWYAGYSTPQHSDDIYRLSGTGVFYRPDDSKYNTEIAKPLVVAVSCNWIREGVINIYPEAATNRVLDYGDGGCEDDATISVNGVITELRVP